MNSSFAAFLSKRARTTDRVLFSHRDGKRTGWKRISTAFQVCPRGTPGRRALRRLNDDAVARAVAKAGGAK